MINIELDRQSAQFRPADLITGTIVWTNLGDDSERLELRLIWYTSGKGTRDVELIETTTIPTRGRPSGKTSFELVAPHRPYSFSGKLLSVTWALELIEFPTRASTNCVVFVSPTGQNIELNNDYTEDPVSSLMGRMMVRPPNS